MSYYDPNQQQPPEYTQYPQQQTGPGMPPPPQYYPTGGLPPQYPPYQPPPMPPQQPPGLPTWAILLFIAIFALAGAAILYGVNKGNTTTTGTQLAATTPTQPASNSGHFKVGDTATTPDGFIVTVLKTYTNSGGDQYGTPTIGDQYFVTDVSVKNTTGQIQHMHISQFTLTDSTGQPIAHRIAMLSTVHLFVGGTLQDGAIMRGQIVYMVPKGNHPYQFTFMGDTFGNYQTIWDIHS